MRLKFLVGAAATILAAAAACSSFEDAPGTVEPDGGSSEASTTTDATTIADGPVADASVDAPRSDTYRAAILAHGPIAYWRMGKVENGLVIRNEVPSGTSLLLSGSPDFTTGAPGIFADDPAVFFGGVGGYATAESSSAFDFASGHPFTVECWARRELHAGGDAGEYFQQVISHVDGFSGSGNQNGFLLYLITANTPRSVFEHGGGDAGSMQVTGKEDEPSKWAHYAVVLDDTQKLAIYIDGEVQGSPQPTKGPMVARLSPFTVAKAANEARRYFRGTIDEVAVYDKALPASAFAAHVAIAKGL